MVHTRARQLLDWLMPALVRFPREHRHTVTKHMAALAMRAHDALVEARHQRGSGRAAALRAADTALDQLRQYGQLAWGWRWWTDSQYQHFSRLCDALGRPLGSWHRQVGDPPHQLGQPMCRPTLMVSGFLNEAAKPAPASVRCCCYGCRGGRGRGKTVGTARPC